MNKALKWVGILVAVPILALIGRLLFVMIDEVTMSDSDEVNRFFTGNEKDRDKLLEQIRANKVISCPGCNLAGIRLGEGYVDYGSVGFARADLSGADLRKVRFPDNLRKSNLSNANLENAQISGSDLSGADLRGSNLTSANFFLAKLVGADLRDANLFETKFYNADLSEANLEGQDLRNAAVGKNPEISNRRVTKFDNSNLRKANLSGMTLSDISFSGADLTEASLADANLESTKLKGANLTRANLTGANLKYAQFNDANLTEAILTNATWDFTILENADLTNATLDVNAMAEGVNECQVTLPTGDVVETDSRPCRTRARVEKERKQKALIERFLKIVQNGSFTACPDKTIKKAVDDFLASPKWKQAVSKDGVPFINVEGKFRFMNAPSTLMVQFIPDGEGFKLNAVDINESTQPILMHAVIVEKLCGSRALKE